MSEYTETYKGYDIFIDQDEYAESPRKWDNIFTMTCWHRRMNLGDHQSTDVELYRVRRTKNARPLYIYDHSGVTLSLSPFNDPWDSGQVGFIYASVDTLRKEFGQKYTDEKVLALMQAEVDTYNQYLHGETYGYRIEKDDEEVDACWGFIGNDTVLTSAKEQVDCFAERDRVAHLVQVKAFIVNHVPLDKRV